jgi:RNA 3'-phosphate cyclase
MLIIDGSQGEGGGQVLRSALTLSILTRQPFEIHSIRAGRSKPGLQPQHLKAVEAAAAISQAQVSGAALNSSRLVFDPGEIKSGNYRFDIRTAGAVTLVLQTIALPLAFGSNPSSVILTGGTHVPWSPCYHYLERQWLPGLEQMGFRARLALAQAGFYPLGMGRIDARIKPVKYLEPFDLMQRGKLVQIRGISGAANLDIDIARRQKLQALRRLEPLCPDTKIESVQMSSPAKGTFILLTAAFEHSRASFSALGAPGKRAELVADEAVKELLAFLATDGSLDPYMADQILLPAAFARGVSDFTTSKISRHLLTNAAVLRLFLPVNIEILGEVGKPGSVRIALETNGL